MKQILPGIRLKPTLLLYLGSKEKIEVASIANTIDRSGLKVLRVQDRKDLYQWLIEKTNSSTGIDFAVLCDLEVLKVENFEFLHTLQSNPSLSSIPIFVHSDEGTTVDKQQLLKLGVDDCLKTPLDWQNVEKKVDFWLKHKSEIRATKESLKIEPKRKPLTSLIKRSFDLTVASVLMFLLSPLFLLLGILIKIDSKGAIFYKSKRVGAGYKTFDFWKFRSMYTDADERLANLLHLNQYDENDSDNCFIKLKNDPRITKVGKIIRKTSLDELPQLINVLRGEMSLVGNRPLPPYEAIMMMTDNRAMRFLAPAGLTGLWQVSKRGKSDMSTEERVNLDVDYARNHSFWYDIKLLLKTLPAMIQEEDV